MAERAGALLCRHVALAAILTVGGGLVAAPAQAGPDQPPNLRERSWYLDSMNIPAAQSVVRGGGTTVAVIDTGVDPDGPALSGQVLHGTEITNAGTTGDGRNDEDGHGTGMASLIAGKGGDDERLLGVAPEAKILPVKITRQADGAFSTENVYRAVVWAVDHGAKVISMSLGGPPTPDAEWKRRLVQYALDHDAVIVAAAGNVEQGQDGPRVSEPAAFPGVVAVSALNRHGEIWAGSQTGPEVVVAAPGELLPFPTHNGYTAASGTSGATALVSGVVALIRSRYPDMSAADVVNRLIRTAQDKGHKGRDLQYGFGAVDALAAVVAEVPRVDRYPLPTVSGETVRPQTLTAAPGQDRAEYAPWLLVGAVLAGLALLAAVFWRAQITVPRFGGSSRAHVVWSKFTQRPLVTVPENGVVEGSALSGRPAQDEA
ncbi:type VII secretion-associated serine protease [Longispora fulva]|uniref:Type VII secretion-associated serine protease mycosin n=1 Tax=Longispora fulva TaxID=619741 RepID=A0A8J7GKX1_9ACTN|nr:S8 family serine peptidase [Longispora fulva]MBG6140066.1 type VII secretion-associated serine protease mycosin [Longispora fulva]GIG57557.1 type VII secretion-associated serine protease [Longispora fulva]